jgi:hypothetical protein
MALPLTLGAAFPEGREERGDLNYLFDPLTYHRLQDEYFHILPTLFVD